MTAWLLEELSVMRAAVGLTETRANASFVLPNVGV